MTLDPDIALLLARMADAPPLEALPLAQARAAAAGLTALQGPPVPVASTTDHIATTASGHAVPVRLYAPLVPLGDPPPLMLFAHGGGWFRCTIDHYDGPCRALAEATGCVVASVDYRLAPEARFPLPLEDVHTALVWATDNAAALGIDADRVIVAGDSAGGNLAAAIALMARDQGGPRIAHQLLIYPVTDHRFDTPSYRDFATGYLLTATAMRACWDHYLARPEDGASPYASPLRAEDLTGLSPATVLTAAFDPLRDEGEAYAHRLMRAGVAVRLERLPGMIHGCIHFGGVVPASRALFEVAGQAVRASLGADAPAGERPQ